MATIHCTVVESPVMPRGRRETFDEPVSPAGYLSPQGSDCQSDPHYNDLLPWADPYIVSLVRGLQAATGAALAEPWPRLTDPVAGSGRLEGKRDSGYVRPRSLDQGQRPERFGPGGRQ